MLIPVRCFTCGKVLADKYGAYVRKVEALDAEAAKPDQPFPYFDAKRTGAVLDELGLDRYCCRRMMLGHVEMMDKI